MDGTQHSYVKDIPSHVEENTITMCSSKANITGEVKQKSSTFSVESAPNSGENRDGRDTKYKIQTNFSTC